MLSQPLVFLLFKVILIPLQKPKPQTLKIQREPYYGASLLLQHLLMTVQPPVVSRVLRMPKHMLPAGQYNPLHLAKVETPLPQLLQLIMLH